MKSLLAVIGVLALAAVLMGASRPTNETSLLIQLYGQPTRFVMTDGGWSGMYGAGQQCMPIVGGRMYMLEGATNFNFCPRPQPSVAWDGGCNTIVGDPNFGLELPARTPQYVLTLPTATHFCQGSDAGSPATAVWRMD